MGIRLNSSSIICKNFLPKNESDKPPIIVIKNTVNIISKPGIEKGKYELGLISAGIKLAEILIKNLLKYKVNPIGISTTTPGTK